MNEFSCNNKLLQALLESIYLKGDNFSGIFCILVEIKQCNIEKTGK